MPRSRISPSLINRNQGAGVKKDGLVSKLVIMAFYLQL